MTTATVIGLVAVILLILTLVAGELDAAVVVMLKGGYTYRQIAAEVMDVEELAHCTGQHSGDVIRERNRD